MSKMKQVLSEFVNRNTSSMDMDTIARELDLNKSTLMAITEFLEREGYIETTETQFSCSNCSSCSSCNSDTKMYRLTLKGKNLANDNP
ncbi:MAG: FeoC-like transcriptional regulator [Methanohalobium sp.]|uniref:FeoC-like transcriptional regulator n=1 Tax=Methanohalobium sp. TaxID=2837493 RepID=UPI00397D297A